MRQHTIAPLAVSPSEALALLGWTGNDKQLRKAAANLQARGSFPIPIIKVGKQKRVRMIDLEKIIGMDSVPPEQQLPEQSSRGRGRPRKSTSRGSK